jgi:hypothetical protein
VFASVYVCSSQDAKVNLDQDIEESNTSKEDIKKIKKSPRREGVLPVDCLCEEHQTVRCHTPDCPVHQEL